MSYNFSKLRGKIVEVYGTIQAFAGAIGITPLSVGKKLSGKSEWTRDEIMKSCSALGIKTADILEYFF